MRHLLVLLLCIVFSFSALAGGRGGHNTTFDPNSYGGGWTCFLSAASGKCQGAATQFFNATCNGVAADDTAQAAWIAYGQSLGASQAKLFIPPGSVCNITGGTQSLTFDGNHGSAGQIQNVLVWAYGASINKTWIGAYGFFNDNLHDALISAANAGDATVTLINGTQISRFSVGGWIAVTALSTQTFGFPPNFFFFEYKLVTAINGSVLTLDSPLKNSYKTTYPQLDTGSNVSINLGGPATIYELEPSWNLRATVLGLNVTNQQGQMNITGRDVVFQDGILSGSTSFNLTMSKNAWVIGSEISDSEPDKVIENASFHRITGRRMTIQSAFGSLNMTSSTLRDSLTGTVQNTAIVNSNVLAFRAGPTCCGHGNSLLVDGFSFGASQANYHYAPSSSFSFASGTLTIAKSDPNYFSSVGLFVPGMKYYFGNQAGVGDCSPKITFTATDVVDAGTNVNIVTDIGASLPSSICDGVSYNAYGAYQLMSLIQRNIPTGTPDLTATAEMLPP
jgi:hypothetical protein